MAPKEMPASVASQETVAGRVPKDRMDSQAALVNRAPLGFQVSEDSLGFLVLLARRAPSAETESPAPSAAEGIQGLLATGRQGRLVHLDTPARRATPAFLATSARPGCRAPRA